MKRPIELKVYMLQLPRCPRLQVRWRKPVAAPRKQCTGMRAENVTMSLDMLLGVSVGLIFRLQLYPTVEFSDSNAERKRREWAAKCTLQAQKARLATVY